MSSHLCSSGQAETVAAGASQAATWQQNAAAWSDRLGRQYPLYRDEVQPVQLAVQELRYGLALLVGSAALAASTPSARLAPVAAQLMAFPRAAAASATAGAALASRVESGPGNGGGGIELDSPAVQQAVVDAAGAAAEARAHEAVAAGRIPASAAEDPAEYARRASYMAAISARLQLLRCSLAATARSVAGARAGAGCASALATAQARLHTIFLGECSAGCTALR